MCAAAIATESRIAELSRTERMHRSNCLFRLVAPLSRPGLLRATGGGLSHRAAGSFASRMASGRQRIPPGPGNGSWLAGVRSPPAANVRGYSNSARAHDGVVEARCRGLFGTAAGSNGAALVCGARASGRWFVELKRLHAPTPNRPLTSARADPRVITVIQPTGLRYPHSISESDVLHRPVNPRPLGRLRRRRARTRRFSKGWFLGGWVDDHRVSEAFELGY